MTYVDLNPTTNIGYDYPLCNITFLDEDGLKLMILGRHVSTFIYMVVVWFLF